MIDLRNESLPNAITVDGKDYFIKTDFRVWLQFYVDFYVEHKPNLYQYCYIFEDVKHLPKKDFIPQFIEFFENENSTPNFNSSDHERVFDYIEDGEYIVASFMQDYGIDLTSCDMHWHLFKALFEGLSQRTIMKEIMGYRSYKKTNKKTETIRQEMKQAWKLNNKKADEELIDEINEMFYNS